MKPKKNYPQMKGLNFWEIVLFLFVISQYLFSKYPQFDEGVLTNLRSLLVNTKSLAETAREIGLGSYLKLSKGEEESKGRQNQSLLADCFEAFVGALFLDRGVETVFQFLKEVLFPKAEIFVQKRAFKDPKSMLQELVQSRKLGSPFYRVIGEMGPAHAKLFKIGVYVDDIFVGAGEGKSKREAEESAAKQALENFKE